MITMKIQIEAKTFATALAKLKPHSKKVRELGPIHIAATGNIIMLTGTLDSSAMAVATVLIPGNGYLPLDSVHRVLKTYKKGTLIELQCEEGYFWINKMKLQVSH